MIEKDRLNKNRVGVKEEKMKKKLLVFVFIGIFLISRKSFSQAEKSQKIVSEEIKAPSKFVKVDRVFFYPDNVPNTIRYNDGYYAGTRYKENRVIAKVQGNGRVYRYSDTVICIKNYCPDIR